MSSTGFFVPAAAIQLSTSAPNALKLAVSF
jgi:hypothetical protein